MNLRSSVLLLFLTFTACRGDAHPFGIVTETPSVSIEELLASHGELQVGGKTLIGEAFLWRDFMPTDRPDTRLRALVHVFTQDSTALPNGLRVTRLWVVNDPVAWETSHFEGDRPTQPIYQLERYAINGPEWEVGTLVDVVVRVEGVPGGAVLLRLPSVSIVRTE
jgi:hypothetical protein